MNKATVSLLLVIMTAGLAWADRGVSETRPLVADGRVEISNISGKVTVEGWSGDGVEITGTLGDGVKELDISSSRDRLRIEVKQEHRRGYSADAYLTIKMPVTANLEVETVSADISVDGIHGDVELESVSGHVEVSGEARSLDAASVSGNVQVTTATGRAELESVSGNVVVRQATGRLEVGAVSGDIEIEGGNLDALQAETVSGSIFCQAAPTDRARFSLESMSGTIEMVIPVTINADIEVETYSGSIKNDIGPEPIRSDEYGPGKELRFTAGSGGARISIESFSGSVKIRTN